MKTLKTAAKKATKTTKRSAINYDKLAAMWAANKTYEEMGKATGMEGNEAKDLYKPVRAAISNMLNGRASAWKDAKGNVKTLAPRSGMRKIGVGKKVKRTKKVVSISKAKKATVKKTVVPKVDGKTAAAGGQ
jgi:hypothetical protein